MNQKDILELIDKVADRGLALLEVERAGTRVRIEGQRTHVVPVATDPPAFNFSPPRAAASAPAATAPGAPAAPAEPVDDDAHLHVITSPIVGTFYRSPNPEAESFVSVGSRVSKGMVLCIIEAMKLMNEIESDVEGTIVRVYPQNAQPVEYGEKLFAVRI